LPYDSFENVFCTLAASNFFYFNPFLKQFSNSTLFIFIFKSNTFDRAYCPGTAKPLCRAMHGGAVEGNTWQRLSH
jgi:hypothetical protein